MSNSLEKAKEWLLKMIEERTTLTDFIIQKETVISKTTYVFDVNYNWQLNSWKKNVSRPIRVVWLQEKLQFATADLFVGGIS